MNDETTIAWTPAKLRNLKKAYEKAKDQKSFMFEGRELVTGYAKHLIEHLETVFKPQKR